MPHTSHPIASLGAMLQHARKPPQPREHEMDRAKLALVKAVLGQAVHCVRGEPDAVDAVALLDDLMATAKAMDAYIAAFGRYANSVLGGIDLSLFEEQVTGALDGNASYELERAAERLGEEAESFDQRQHDRAVRMEVE